MGKDGQLLWHNSGEVTTMKKKPVERYIRRGNKKYSLVGASGDKRRATLSAGRWRKQYGGALVRQLEKGNYGIYATI